MVPHIVQQPKKRISTSMKAALITIPLVLLVVLIFIVVALFNRPEAKSVDGASGSGGGQSSVPMVQENSHVLDDAGEGAPVLVEFLDFECEACGGVYPVIEEIRKLYDGELTYVARYFITNHANSMNAAIAAEAAGQQGKFEEMYRKLFESQPEWAEQQDSQADKIRGYAEAIGLDMDAYDQAVADPSTQMRVEEDHNAGITLGVRGTPSFFLDGELLQPESFTDLTDAIDAAIAKDK